MIRLMTYNIRVGVESDLAHLAAAIRHAGVPDVLALQEVGVRWNMGERVDQPAVLGAQLGLPFNAFAGALLDSAGGRFGVALLSRWPLRRVQTTILPCIEDEQRILLRATVAAPTPFTVLNTHLSVKAEERLLQAQQIALAVASESGPLVLMGDLNDQPGTPVLKAACAGLLDSFDHCGAGDARTFSVRQPEARIDYIAGRGMGFEAAQVVRTARASDHFPLIVSVPWFASSERGSFSAS